MKAEHMPIVLCACLIPLLFASGCARPGAEPAQPDSGVNQITSAIATPIPGTEFTDEFLELDPDDALDSIDVLSSYTSLEAVNFYGATVPADSRLAGQSNLDGLRALYYYGLVSPDGDRLDAFDFLADVLPLPRLESLLIYSSEPGAVLPKIETLKVIEISAPNAPEIVSANTQASTLYLSGQNIVDDLDALSAFTELEELVFPVNVKNIEGLKSFAKLKYLVLDTPLKASEIEAYLAPLYELQNLEHVTLGFLMRDDGSLILGPDFDEYIEIITNLPSSVLEHFRVDPHDNRELPLLRIPSE
jgi:hypothetical protein